MIAGDILGLGLVGRDDTMAQDVRGDLFDVFGCHKAAALQEGVGVGGQDQVDAGAGEAPNWIRVFRSARPLLPGWRVRMTRSST